MVLQARSVLPVLIAVLVAAAATGARSEVASAHDPADPWRDDLRPITAADWDAGSAAHLLERAGFGGTPEEIAAMAARTPEEAVAHLVRWQQVADVPLPSFKPSGIFPSDGFVPPLDGDLEGIAVRAFFTRRGLGVKLGWRLGGPWLQPLFDQFFYLLFANGLETARLAQFEADRMVRTRRPLREKLALFWHGHFATEVEKVRDYRKMAAQYELFRELGTGSFRDLLRAVARDPAMLIYLDGAKNVRAAPNENFARELLELFTLGPGPYDEHDIKEAARAFTGWNLAGNEFRLRRLQHDRGKKSFLGVEGRLDGDDVIDVILDHPQTARFLAAKLYRYFVRQDLSEPVHDALAQRLREADYEIAPLLETLLLSRDFHSRATRGSHVKSPVELVVSTWRKLGVRGLPGLPVFSLTTKNLGQGLFEPPNVAGWSGGRAWLNPSTLTGRQNFARLVLFPGEQPPPDQTLHEIIVTGSVGPEIYQQMARMDLEGRQGEPVAIDPAMAGMRRQAAATQGAFSLPWAIWNGADKAIGAVRLGDLAHARFEVGALVRGAGARDARGATEILARRFLASPLSERQQELLAGQLSARMGGDGLDWSRPEIEQDLRELLHLILSLPEYQVSWCARVRAPA